MIATSIIESILMYKNNQEIQFKQENNMITRIIGGNETEEKFAIPTNNLKWAPQLNQYLLLIQDGKSKKSNDNSLGNYQIKKEKRQIEEKMGRRCSNRI